MYQHVSHVFLQMQSVKFEALPVILRQLEINKSFMGNKTKAKQSCDATPQFENRCWQVREAE